MTLEEARTLEGFTHYCTCGAYAGKLTGDTADPHLYWCPQKEEYRQWYAAMFDNDEEYLRWLSAPLKQKRNWKRAAPTPNGS
jgi:hypothetical protein